MKDEELAEEYRKSLKQRLIDEDNFERLEMFDENVEEAFLAGLKAGRPQWHILAEEPDVLPEEGQKVKVLTEEGDIENSTYFYDTYYEEFAFSNIGLLKVFAWKEITSIKEIEK